MKKLFKAIIKLLCLPFAVVFFLMMMFVGRAIGFFEWVYDVKQSNFDKEITKEMFDDLERGLKNSFKVF